MFFRGTSGLILRRAQSIVILLLAALTASSVRAQKVTLTGVLQAGNGLPAANDTLTFQPTQWFYIAGTTVVVQSPFTCGTSVDGSAVGVGNPLSGPVTAAGFSGTLPAASYYVEIAWYDAAGNITLVSPEVQQQLTLQGNLQISPPASGMPGTALGMKVYIGTASSTETLQGATTGGATFTQSTPLASGANPQTTNTTLCQPYANDAGWPSYTGYATTLTDANGNLVPGFPMVWRLLGAGSTYNLSNGMPLYNGQVIYPTPLLAEPPNHNPQSISGPLDLTDYKLTDVGMLGIDTATPGWGVDVEGAGLAGQINAQGGYLYDGAAPNNHVLLGDGTAYVDSATIPYSILSGAPGLFYQTVDANAVAQTQRPALNFSSRFAVTDSASPARTNVDVPATGTGAKVVSAAGAGTAAQFACWTSAGDVAGQTSPCGGGTTQFLLNQNTCTPPNSTDGMCTGSLAFGTSFADSGWGGWTQVTSSNGAFLYMGITSKSASGFNYFVTCTFNCSAVPQPTVDVVAYHP